jgi:O-antigen/teichoic acid export membrane protein
MVLNAPFRFVGWGLSHVFFQQAAEFNRGNILPNLVEAVYKRIIGFTVLPFFILLLMGKDIFLILLGERFDAAGFYVQVLSLGAFFSFAFWPLSRLLGVKEKYLRGLLINIVLLLPSLSLLITGYLTNDSMSAITIFGISSALAYLFSSLWLLAMAGIYFTTVFLYLIQSILRYLPILGLIVLIKWKIGVNDANMLIVLLFISSVYYMVTVLRDKNLVSAMRESFLNTGSNVAN